MTVAGADSVPSILLGRVTATVTGEVTMGERGKERRSEGRRIKTDNNGRVPEYRYTCTDTALALQLPHSSLLLLYLVWYGSEC